MADEFKYTHGKPDRGASRVYEDELKKNYSWAVNEGGLHFDKNSQVYKAMRRVTTKLDQLNIPYVLVGGLALLEHGFARFTEDVDLLVTKESLARIHHELEGRGYRPVFAKSKNLRDAELGVKIEFLLTGEYPGDGKPKPVSFPDPANVHVVKDGVRVINLESLIDLKLASGMSHSDRLKDLSDIQELIKTLGLGRDFVDRLSPYVRERYLDLLPKQTKYVTLWRNKFLTVDADNIDEMFGMLASTLSTLESMKNDGVKLDPDGGTADDYAMLYTYDADIARKYDMHPENEYWGQDEEDDSASENDPG